MPEDSPLDDPVTMAAFRERCLAVVQRHLNRPPSVVTLEDTTQEDLDRGILRARFSMPAEYFLGRTARELREMRVEVPPDILDDAYLERAPGGGVQWSQITLSFTVNVVPPGYRQEILRRRARQNGEPPPF